MENDKNSNNQDSAYSKKVKAGRRRTYFFDVRKTKGDDFYLTLTESTKRFNGDGYERHKIFLYKEDFNRFVTTLEDVINYVKTELMPHYDYDEFTRRQEEWEAREAEENNGASENSGEPRPTTTRSSKPENEEDNIGW
ncbi:MAG: DUF3276 family protein [Saprospirales bacterium]|nr:DUF3276 family protein [Saprospirales bacterium]MBK6901869.1 DUF3276 family protein [Saprospirales bacterium]MBK7336461.1 DUF3276 family protein [Saprospirales bacterium]